MELQVLLLVKTRNCWYLDQVTELCVFGNYNQVMSIKTLKNSSGLGTIRNLVEIEDDDYDDDYEFDEENDEEDVEDYFAYTCVTFNAKGDLVFVGDTTGNLTEWNLKNNKSRLVARDGGSTILAVAVSLDSQVAVLGNEIGNLMVWNLKDKKKLFDSKGA